MDGTTYFGAACKWHAGSTHITKNCVSGLLGVKNIVQELPNINFIWSFWTILPIFGEILLAYSIGELDQWDKLFSNNTGRRQTDLHNLVIGVIDEEHLRPLILSTSIILKGETSEQKVDSLLSTIAGCGNWLQWWKEVLDHWHPSYHYDISDPSSMNIGKLGRFATLASDTCNGVRKTCRLIYDKFHEATEDLRKYNSDYIRV